VSSNGSGAAAGGGAIYDLGIFGVGFLLAKMIVRLPAAPSGSRQDVGMAGVE
jgi:hypothetical protein